MTAGSGIIHQEMPEPIDGRMGGFQLWVNLPRSHKMREPRYQEITYADIPEIRSDDGVTIRVICGTYKNISGPVRDIIADPLFFDVSLPSNAVFRHEIVPGYTVFCYVIEGAVTGHETSGQVIRNREAVLFNDGNRVRLQAGDIQARFLLLAGKPIREPVAWYGPVVMNSQEELREAFKEYRNGTFIRARHRE
jgi:redox-sensitive bicupin YhaK (pirin superfamily)